MVHCRNAMRVYHCEHSVRGSALYTFEKNDNESGKIKCHCLTFVLGTLLNRYIYYYVHM